MKSRRLDVLSLRVVRKSSHLSRNLAKGGAHFLERVENKATRLIVERSGAPDAHHNIDANALFYAKFPHLVPIAPVLPVLGQKPSVTVFAFLDPRGFYAGIATLLCVAGSLANKLGYDLRVAQTTGFSATTDVIGFLESQGIHIPPDRYSTLDLSKRSIGNYANLPLHPDDVIMVSAWWDAQIASALPLKNKFVYLLQDYEPIFYNNSDSSALADQTYLTNRFLPLCNTELLYTFFAAKGYDYIRSNALWFEPAPAPKLKPLMKKNYSKKRRLFLYARPNVDRNLYYMSLLALDQAFQDERLAQFEWELFCAGSSEVPNVRLRSGHVVSNLGKMPLDEYYRFGQSINVALAPMLAPHPNYVTLELASLGSMVVTTRWETKQSLDRYSPNILMAEPTIQNLAETIIEAALTTREKRNQGLSQTHIGNDWETALNKPIREIARRLTS